MKKKKKIIILSCMIALLAVTAVFNFIMSTDSIQNTSNNLENANFFSQYRAERLSTRNEELLQLDAIISASSEGATERVDALNMKRELTELTEKEMLLETLIKAYGFEDVVVVIGLDSQNVNVIAKCSELTADDSIAIYTIICDEMVASPENVKIIPIS